MPIRGTSSWSMNFPELLPSSAPLTPTRNTSGDPCPVTRSATAPGLPVHHPGGRHGGRGRDRELRRVCANDDSNSVGAKARDGGGDLALILDVAHIEGDGMAGDAAVGVHHLRGEGCAEILVGRARSGAAGEREDRPDTNWHRPRCGDRGARGGEHREDQRADQPEGTGTFGPAVLWHRPILARHAVLESLAGWPWRRRDGFAATP